MRPTDFITRTTPEPHKSRREEILQAHPEIKSLFGHEPRTKYLVAATVALQVAMAAWVRSWGWMSFLTAAYIVGATANHSLFLAIHELSHGLGAKTPAGNKLISMVANMPICIAYCITFKPYHMEHHRYQGDHLFDTDIPSKLEAYLITESVFGGYIDHTLRKIVFMFFQIFGYALRPMFIKPDIVSIDRWLVLNWAICLAFDAAIVFTLGFNALLYLLVSTFLAGSIHPTAGHFIAEHYVFEGKTETYSYYGPLNMLAYNVGYHNEHHDFPSIAWSKLPEVRKIAPTFYNDLPQCKSWPGAILKYLFDDSISPFSRVKKYNDTKKVS